VGTEVLPNVSERVRVFMALRAAFENVHGAGPYCMAVERAVQHVSGFMTKRQGQTASEEGVGHLMQLLYCMDRLMWMDHGQFPPNPPHLFDASCHFPPPSWSPPPPPPPAPWSPLGPPITAPLLVTYSDRLLHLTSTTLLSLLPSAPTPLSSSPDLAVPVAILSVLCSAVKYSFDTEQDSSSSSSLPYQPAFSLIARSLPDLTPPPCTRAREEAVVCFLLLLKLHGRMDADLQCDGHAVRVAHLLHDMTAASKAIVKGLARSYFDAYTHMTQLILDACLSICGDGIDRGEALRSITSYPPIAPILSSVVVPAFSPPLPPALTIDSFSLLQDLSRDRAKEDLRELRMMDFAATQRKRPVGKALGLLQLPSPPLVPISADRLAINRMHLLDIIFQSFRFHELQDRPSQNASSSKSDSSHYLTSELLSRCTCYETPPTYAQYNDILPRRSPFERDRFIRDLFASNPILFSLFELIADDGEDFGLCFEIAKSLLASVIGVWNSELQPDSTKCSEYSFTIRLLSLLHRGGVLPPPLCFAGEIIQYIPPPEVVAILMSIWTYLRDFPPPIPSAPPPLSSPSLSFSVHAIASVLKPSTALSSNSLARTSPIPPPPPPLPPPSGSAPVPYSKHPPHHPVSSVLPYLGTLKRSLHRHVDVLASYYPRFFGNLSLQTD